MAHRGSFRRSGISQSQRRKKTWGAFTAPTTTAFGSSPAGVQSTTLSFNASLPLNGLTSPQETAAAFAFDTDSIEGIDPESTLMRLRGSLNMEKNSISSVEVENHAFGIAVVETTNTLGANPKFPNPANPAGAQWDGWMFYRSINSAILDAEGSIVDVKSMRKIQSGYSLIFVVGAYISMSDDTVFGVTTFTVAAQLTARGLFLLP